MADPWTFGWTQLLTIIGFVITLVIALGGLRTFKRWRREKLEERKIEIAFDALSIAYETKFVFEHIRSVMASSPEWSEMPQLPDDDDNKRSRRGSFYAVFKRIEQNKDFFERVWKLQPRFMAIFGPHVEAIFVKLHSARRDIEVAAQMLFQQALEQERSSDKSTRELYEQMRADLWAPYGARTKDGDKVGKKLDEFRTEMEALCAPIVASFRMDDPKSFWSRHWFSEAT